MVEQLRILIVDDHPLFREGVMAMLSKVPGYQVVGEASSGEEGLKKARELHPALVLMDISLPDMNGIDATRRIHSTLPDIKVIMLSIHTKINFITDAFRAGALGYMTKDVTGEKLLECIDTAMKGEYYMDRSVSHAVAKNLLAAEEKKGNGHMPGYDTLTLREQEIMRLIAEGRSTKQISQQLFISQKTVENHRTNIFSKLDIHSTMELVNFAAKYGFIDVDLWKE